LVKGGNNMATSTEVYTEAESIDFEFENKKYCVSGVVYHQCYTESCGIGSYEYQGAKESDDSYEYVSEFKDATYKDIIIADDGGNEVPRTGVLLEQAKEAMWEATLQEAQEKACDL
jgi:hypothetical protein